MFVRYVFFPVVGAALLRLVAFADILLCRVDCCARLASVRPVRLRSWHEHVRISCGLNRRHGRPLFIGTGSSHKVCADLLHLPHEQLATVSSRAEITASSATQQHNQHAIDTKSTLLGPRRVQNRQERRRRCRRAGPHPSHRRRCRRADSRRRAPAAAGTAVVALGNAAIASACRCPHPHRRRRCCDRFRTALAEAVARVQQASAHEVAAAQAPAPARALDAAAQARRVTASLALDAAARVVAVIAAVAAADAMGYDGRLSSCYICFRIFQNKVARNAVDSHNIKIS